MNLKTAARRLGVHYQTAYRWVRSGELVAVKVGSGYEISDAALGRFQAQRAALERVPDVAPESPATAEQPGSLDLLDAMVGQVVVDTSAVDRQAARVVATALGDLGVVRVDGTLAFEHADPQRAVLTGTLVHRGWREGRISDRAEQDGTPVFVPQVAQRDVRPVLREEFHQYLGEYGLFSAIAVPVVVGGKVRGSVFAGRDEPGRPYSVEDRDFVIDVAARVSGANERAERAREAWALRARLLDELVARGDTPYDDWLASAVGEDDAVAVVAPDTVIVSATTTFAELLGAKVSDLGAISDHVDDADDLRLVCDRVLDGEIDYFSVVGRGKAHGSPHVMLHGGAVRTPDATPRCIVVVGHTLADAGDVLSGVRGN